MLNFQRLDLNQKAQYNHFLMNYNREGCEFSFANLYLWGDQRVCLWEDKLLLFSQFDGNSVYPYPIGPGDPKKAVDALMEDARERGIPFWLTSLSQTDCEALEAMFPGRFQFHTVRDNFDYVYDINDLADLKGRKFQKKRNHVNRFRQEHPDYQVLPLDEHTRAAAYEMLSQWYDTRLASDPGADFQMEQIALERAFQHQQQLGLEGIVLVENGRILAFTMGSRLSADTFDIHFEKAREDVDGAYAAINQEFARYLREKYPQVQFLDREDDLGIEGLRKAKLSYNPHHMVEKHRAQLMEAHHEN